MVLSPNNRKAIPAFLISLLTFVFILTIPIAHADIQFNGGFESTANENNITAGQNVLFLGCQKLTKTFLRPTGWNFYSRQIGGFTSDVPLDDAKIVTGFVKEGSNALAMWWIPAGNCEINITNPTLPSTNITQGHFAVALSNPIPVNTSALQFSIDIANLNFYPPKCEGGNFEFCQIEFYGSTCVTPTGESDSYTFELCKNSGTGYSTIKPSDARSIKIHFNATTSNGTQTIIQGVGATSPEIDEAQGVGFSNKIVSLSQFLPSDVFQIQIEVDVYQVNGQSGRPMGFIIDNLKLIPENVTPSVAETFIRDMTTFVSFPHSEVFEAPISTPNITEGVSKSFDGVAMAFADIKFNGCLGSNSTFSGNITERYNDGTFLNVAKQASGFYATSNTGVAPQTSRLFVVYPIVHPEILNRIDFRLTPSGAPACEVKVNMTYNDQLGEIRGIYGNNIVGPADRLDGMPDLYPLIAYHQNLFSNGTQLYSIYNFAGQLGTPIDDADVFFELLDSNGVVKNLFEVPSVLVLTAFSNSSFESQASFGDGENAIRFIGDQNKPIRSDIAKPLDYFTRSTTWLSNFSVAQGDKIRTKVRFDEDVVASNFLEGSSGTMYSSNTSNTFNVFGFGAFSGVCESFCVGTTRFRAFESSFGGANGICSFTEIQLDPICVVQAGQQVQTTFATNRTVAILGLQSSLDSAGIGFLGIFATPIAIVFYIILGLGIYAETKVKSQGVVFLGTLLTGSLIVTFFGVFPVEVAILVIIISGALLVVQARKLIAGGGSNG